jgi:putative FmdB family regulatory protein
MPLYEYVCNQCGYKKEIMRTIDERNNPLPCDKCDSPMEILISPTPTKFIGDGWTIPAVKRNWPKKEKVDRFDVASGNYVKDSRDA